jgi:hypothetical protein
MELGWGGAIVGKRASELAVPLYRVTMWWVESGDRESVALVGLGQFTVLGSKVVGGRSSEQRSFLGWSTVDNCEGEVH